MVRITSVGTHSLKYISTINRRFCHRVCLQEQIFVKMHSTPIQGCIRAYTKKNKNESVYPSSIYMGYIANAGVSNLGSRPSLVEPKVLKYKALTLTFIPRLVPSVCV